MKLVDLVEGVTSWAELEARISNLPSEKDRGETFEEFCKGFFLLDPVFQFEKIYQQNEIPASLRSRLGYPGIQDIGIDGVALTADGKLFAYQTKFRKYRTKTPSLRELSTFFTVSDRADWRITITNANNLPPSVNERTRHSRVLVDRLDQLDPDFFIRLRRYLQDQTIFHPEKKTPNKTQQEAIDVALSYFKGHDKGQLILPCGTGKTLASMWIAERLESKRILVMVPSLALMSQTLREWAANTSIRPFRYLCLCSDTTVDLGNDSPIEHFYEMDIPVTTEVGAVSDFLVRESSTNFILFSTYQSSKVLSEAVTKTSTIFDIGIFDEAHRTTGTNIGVWSIALRDEKVPIKCRIFMTATPRIYAPHITKKAKENDLLICSMDDPAFYGNPFYEMTFGEAIERGHITDYKVVVICVTDSEVQEVIEHGGKVVIGDEYEWDARALAKRVALVKGLKAYRLKKIFTFHGRVQGAKAFTDTTTPYGIHQVFKLAESENSEQKGTKFFHVNGTMSSGVRNSFMKEFTESEIGIMSNARCLIEGVDVPAVDTVAFIDPKRSLIDIVQATGRAMRKAEWKEKGYIFIPVIVEENTDPAKFIDSSDFETVWKVLQAMVDQDQRLKDIVSKLRVMQGKGEEATQEWKDAMIEFTEKIEFFNLPRRIDKTRFTNALYTKTVEIIGRTWDFWFGLTLAHKEQFGDPNVTKYYETSEGYKLGAWQDNIRQRKGKLDAERIRRLEGIGFKWILRDEFGKGLQETLKYKVLFGDPNAPRGYKVNGYNLGYWQASQRHFYKKGSLALDRIRRLEDIGFRWDRFGDAFEKGFQETLKYKEQFGHLNASREYISPEGYKLGAWQMKLRAKYRKGKLSRYRIKRFEEIGFKWDPYAQAFEKGFQETLKYKEHFGDSNASYKYTTPEGYKLWVWQGDIRQRYKRKKLTHDRIQRLEEIGFKWAPHDQAFERGFHETLNYKKKFGDPNAAIKYITPDGYKLWVWQDDVRQRYKRKKLTPDRIQKLEEIGFKWSAHDEAFEKGLLEALKYKEQFGNPNSSYNYITPKGYKLGVWQDNVRQRYKKGKLPPDRIQRLEAIGFNWQIRGTKEHK
jgi:superfamily II DNA or RNA helicase